MHVLLPAYLPRSETMFAPLKIADVSGITLCQVQHTTQWLRHQASVILDPR